MGYKAEGLYRRSRRALVPRPLDDEREAHEPPSREDFQRSNEARAETEQPVGSRARLAKKYGDVGKTPL